MAARPQPAGRLHLLLKAQAEPAVLEGLLISDHGAVALPALSLKQPPGSHLLTSHQRWLRCLPGALDDALPREERQQRRKGLQSTAQSLLQAMRTLLQQGGWEALHQALQRDPHQPLLLEFPLPPGDAHPDHGIQAGLAALPWELALAPPGAPQSGESSRAIWRVQSLPDSSWPRRVPATQRSWREPRLLVVLGPNEGLDTTSQTQKLEALRRRGPIQLELLEGETATAAGLLARLADPRGWDGLVYLGHGQPHRPGEQPGLDLASGERLSGDRLLLGLRQAAPQLVLLSSCHGTDLVPLCLQGGVPWVLAFRGEVPDPAALAAFDPFLKAVEQGAPVVAACQAAQVALDQRWAGSSPLLCLLSRVDAPPLQLPLRRVQLWRQRLASSQIRQGKAIAAVLALGLGLQGCGSRWDYRLALLLPENQGIALLEARQKLLTPLLDLRLHAQASWRRWSEASPFPGQGQRQPPLVVWLVNSRLAYSEGATGFSRSVLRRLLTALPPQATPQVGIDLVLDDNDRRRPDPDTPALAALIREQRRPRLFNTYFQERSPGKSRSGASSKPSSLLQAAGLKPLKAGGVGYGHGAPLQLVATLGEGLFAAELAEGAARGAASARRANLRPEKGHGRLRMPAGSVIDWSLDWFDPSQIQVVPLHSMAAIDRQASRPLPGGATVLIGVDHRAGRERRAPYTPYGELDLFEEPAALSQQPSWQALRSEARLPGVLLQAVLVNSLRHNHWFTPLAPVPTAALTGGLGVLLAAVLTRRRSQLLALLVISLLAVAAVLEVALAARLLVPLLLPLAALWAGCLSRCERRP